MFEKILRFLGIKKRYLFQPFYYLNKDGTKSHTPTDKFHWLEPVNIEDFSYYAASKKFWQMMKEKYNYYTYIKYL